MTLAFPRSFFWFLGLALGVVACAVLIVQSQMFQLDPHWLSLGITMDIALGIPLLYYFLVVRRQSVSWVTTLVVFLIAVGIAHWVLPSDHQYFLGFAEQALIVTESVVVLYGISRIRKIVAAFKISARTNPDTIENLQYSLEEVMGKHTGTQLAVNEIATFYYGLFFWRAHREVQADQAAFTYHRESAYPAMIGALMLVTVAETIGLHWLLSHWSEGVALTFTVLSIYSFLFLWADLVAVLKRPIVLDEDQLHLRIGLRWRATIPLHLIDTVQRIPDTFSKDKSVLNLALMTPPNAIVNFREEVPIQGLYGMNKTVLSVTLPIDDYVAFEQALLKSKDKSSC